jgi:zinc/manganese transport system permease protein
MSLYDFAIAPFETYSFMRRALAACWILTISGVPLGVFLNLRRMALLGDAMSHAILPGVAIAFAVSGLAIWPMTLAALTAGIVVAFTAFTLTRVTQLKEDSSFTLIYLLSIAGGVTIISTSGSGVDLLHILFGNILAIDNDAMYLAMGTACATSLGLALLYRGLVIDCFDPDFLRAALRKQSWIGQAFFVLIVVNLVAAFQILGTLMALGLMLLPAIAARFWSQRIDASIVVGMGIAAVSAYMGLVLSYHSSVPAGPAVVLVTGGFCLISVIFGRYQSVRSYLAGS